MLARCDEVILCFILFYSSTNLVTRATRLQIPLALSFACTVYKAQGLSLQHVEVNCAMMRYAGLLSVAISRVTSVAGLALTGFTKSCVIGPDRRDQRAIDSIYNDSSVVTDSAGVRECCEQLLPSVSALTYYEFSEEGEDSDDEFSDGEEDQLISEDTEDNSAFLSEFFVKNPSTDQETTDNGLLNRLKTSSVLRQILVKFSQKVVSMWTLYIKDRKNSLHISNYLRASHQYITSPVPELEFSLVSNMYHHLFRLFFAKIESLHIKAAADEQQLPPQEPEPVASTSTETSTDGSRASEGVIRRVAGRTVRKVLNLYKRKEKAAIKAGRMEHYIELKHVKAHVQHMVVSLDAVLSGKFPYTACETERRQNEGGGLLHVSDEVFCLFMEIEKQRKQYHSPNAAKQLGSQVLSVAYRHLLDDDMLRGMCMKIFTNMPMKNEVIIAQLYVDLLYKYIPVANNSFRKRLLTDFKVGKEQQALRTKIKSLNKKKVRHES